MQRLTLAERVEHFKLTFPRNQAAWPWLVKEKGLPVLYAVWLGGGDYRNKTRYHGAYPHGLLEKLMALFPDIGPDHTLHAFAGSVPKGRGLRLDLNPATAPDILGTVYDVAALVGDRRFRLVCADPPYTEADNRKYGQEGGINRGRATRALAAVTAARGFLTWLDTRAPIYSASLWRIVGRIYIDRSTGHAIRRLAIFERVGAHCSGFSTSNEKAKPEQSPVSASAGTAVTTAGQTDQQSLAEQASDRGVANLQAARCARGYHGPLVDGEPIDLGDTVQVDHICTECAVIVSYNSWTKAAWLEHVAKRERVA